MAKNFEGSGSFFLHKKRAKNCTMLHLLYFLSTCGSYLFEGDSKCDCDAELYEDVNGDCIVTTKITKKKRNNLFLQCCKIT